MGCASSKSVDAPPPPRFRLVRYGDHHLRDGSPLPTLLEIVEHTHHAHNPSPRRRAGGPSAPAQVDEVHESLLFERHYQSARWSGCAVYAADGDRAGRLSTESGRDDDSLTGVPATHRGARRGRGGAERLGDREEDRRRLGSGRRSGSRRRRHSLSGRSDRNGGVDEVSREDGGWTACTHTLVGAAPPVVLIRRGRRLALGCHGSAILGCHTFRTVVRAVSSLTDGNLSAARVSNPFYSGFDESLGGAFFPLTLLSDGFCDQESSCLA